MQNLKTLATVESTGYCRALSHLFFFISQSLKCRTPPPPPPLLTPLKRPRYWKIIAKLPKAFSCAKYPFMHLVRGRQLERWTRVNLLCKKKKTNECKSLFTPPHALKPLLYLFQLLRLLASSTKK